MSSRSTVEAREEREDFLALTDEEISFVSGWSLF